MTIKLMLVPAMEKGLCNGCAHYRFAPNYIPVTHCNEQAVSEHDEDTCLGGGRGQIWVKDVRPCVPTARANDPATSKGKRRVNKYEQAVLAALGEPIQHQGPGLLQGVHPVSRTGKEIASLTGYPLNCITPRFAPLRRKGLIKAKTVVYPCCTAPSVVKRDNQIVWVLA